MLRLVFRCILRARAGTDTWAASPSFSSASSARSDFRCSFHSPCRYSSISAECCSTPLPSNRSRHRMYLSRASETRLAPLRSPRFGFRPERDLVLLVDHLLFGVDGKQRRPGNPRLPCDGRSSASAGRLEPGLQIRMLHVWFLQITPASAPAFACRALLRLQFLCRQQERARLRGQDLGQLAALLVDEFLQLLFLSAPPSSSPRYTP